MALFERVRMSAMAISIWFIAFVSQVWLGVKWKPRLLSRGESGEASVAVAMFHMSTNA